MDLSEVRSARVLSVVAAIAVGAASVGLWANLSRQGPALRAFGHGPRVSQAAVPAPTQRGLSLTRSGPNRARHALAFRDMQRDQPDPLVEVPFDPAARAAAVASRAQRRAYDGAPPGIPHPIAQMDTPNCVACHAQGLRVRAHNASVISHPFMSSCVQCHTVMEQAMPGPPLAGDLSAGNTFVGRPSPGLGERAWPGAPPTIPHTTRMRESCASCHGALSTGLRTSHPWRQSCEQCHAPSAELNLRAGLLP